MVEVMHKVIFRINNFLNWFDINECLKIQYFYESGFDRSANEIILFDWHGHHVVCVNGILNA